MRRLAYIPARAGSKGIPKKNIYPLLGKPLLAWIVKAAQETGLFDRIMVSTDSEEFAEIARACGAWVPFLRDPAVATDGSSSTDAVCSDRARLEAMGETFDMMCLLETTSPLCRPEDIAGAVAMFERVKASVISLGKCKSRIMGVRIVDKDGRARQLVPTDLVRRRQDEPVFYEINGAIYIHPWSELTPDLKFGQEPYAYLMDPISSIDIDDMDDLELAEKYLKKRLGL